MLNKTNHTDLEQQLKVLEEENAKHKQMEHDLQVSENKFQLLFETINDAVLVHLLDENGMPGNFVEVNQAACQRLGYSKEELLALTPIQIRSKDSETNPADIISHLERHDNMLFETMHVTKDGQLIPVEGNLKLFNYDGRKAVLSISRDITKRKHAEEALLIKEAQLLRAQKMETVGIVSGGIAHEFNNLLYIISGTAEILMMNSDSEDKMLLQEIFKSTKVGANLVKQLATFSQKTESILYTTNINIEVKKVIKMLQRVLPRRIDIKMDLAENLLPIKADAGQLEQVIINLCTNARDAMPDGGTLTIKTENGVLDEAFTNAIPFFPSYPVAPVQSGEITEKLSQLSEGKCIIVSVSDTGCGMDYETRNHIFDPFFTTKDVGKGTGLGLSVIYGIVEGHRGHISVDSEPDKGTTFKICFPAIEQEQASSNFASAAENLLLKGTETILIVDDEASILNLTKTMLSRMGYKILTATTGEDALSIFSENYQSIDIVLLDLEMPGMGGKMTLTHLVDFDPNVKVIVASGYSEEKSIMENIYTGAKGYVIKPFTSSEVSKVIRNVLDKPSH